MDASCEAAPKISDFWGFVGARRIGERPLNPKNRRGLLRHPQNPKNLRFLGFEGWASPLTLWGAMGFFGTGLQSNPKPPPPSMAPSCTENPKNRRFLGFNGNG